MRTQLLTLDHLVQLMDPQLYLHLQSAESTNFFFFFRMLLVWYKREFEWPDVLRLWETLWTDYLSSSFHLFVALGILEKNRDVIMDHLKHFDEVLKYSTPLLPCICIGGNERKLTRIVNELSNSMELLPILTRAESLFRRFERTVHTIDKKNSFPAPSAHRRATTNTPNSPNTAKGKASSTGPGSGSGASSGIDTGASPRPGQNDARVISPELWMLLRRDIPWARDVRQAQAQEEQHT